MIVGHTGGLPIQQIAEEARQQGVDIECQCAGVDILPRSSRNVGLVIRLLVADEPSRVDELVVHAKAAGIPIAAVAPATFAMDLAHELGRLGVSVASPEFELVGRHGRDAWWTWNGFWWVATGRT